MSVMTPILMVPSVYCACEVAQESVTASAAMLISRFMDALPVDLHSLRLDAGLANDHRPSLGVLGDEFAELRRRSDEHGVAEVGVFGLNGRAREARVDLAIEHVDDLGRRSPRCGHA